VLEEEEEDEEEEEEPVIKTGSFSTSEEANGAGGETISRLLQELKAEPAAPTGARSSPMPWDLEEKEGGSRKEEVSWLERRAGGGAATSAWICEDLDPNALFLVLKAMMDRLSASFSFASARERSLSTI
jgi:hypothetical protein